ncbi:MAG: hypothetical protein U0670_12075 [Anaerolineae bacterium]
MLLEAGSIVSGQHRVIENNLRAMEASLTGRSQAVEKQVAPLADAKRRSATGAICCSWASITYGRGTAGRQETRMKTQLGRIRRTDSGSR